MDVDGVVRNFHAGAIDLINSRMGTSHVAADVKAWNIFKALGVPPKTTSEIYDAMRAPGWCGALQPYGDAVAGVARLRKVCNVYPLTSPMRGPNRGPCAPYWPHETEQWLKTHFGFDCDDVIHGTPKRLVHARFLVEDKISTLMSWVENDPTHAAHRDSRDGTDLSHLERVAIHFNRTQEQFAGIQVHNWTELCEVVERYL